MKRWTRLAAKLQEWCTNTRRQPPAAAGSPMMLRCRDVADLIPRSLEASTLDHSERQAFEAHIADCVNCWRFLKTYHETVALGQQLQEETMPPEVRGRLETFLRSRLPRSS